MGNFWIVPLLYSLSDMMVYYVRDMQESKFRFLIVLLVLRREGINPLNVELNPICHLLILLGDLTFMGPCIVSIFQYISNKMQR
jgi:hypothetical protein